MGLFGGSKSSANTTVTEYNFANYGGAGGSEGAAPANFNLAGITLNSSRGSNSNLTIKTGDYGAIEAGRSLAQTALDSGGQAFERALSFVKQSNRDNTAALAATTDMVVSKSLGIAEANQKPEGSQLLDAIKQIAIGIAVAVVVGVIVKGSK